MDYRARLIDREMVSNDILIVRFEKPEGFTFLPGQFCFVTVPEVDLVDEKGFKRPLSIASSPLEAEVMFVVRLTGSAFKTSLKQMEKDQEVVLAAPVGLFTLPGSPDRPLSFLAGGLGITPFRSMLAYVAQKPEKHRITLLYSSRSTGEAVFLEELRNFERASSNIRLLPTVTRAEPGELWTGLVGRISPDMIRENCPDWAQASYYIAGPPAMVDGMRGMLDQMGVRTENVKIEKWVGY